MFFTSNYAIPPNGLSIQKNHYKTIHGIRISHSIFVRFLFWHNSFLYVPEYNEQERDKKQQ